MNRFIHLCLLIFGLFPNLVFAADEKRYLYVAVPGIRNYLEFGGAGILVFDVDKDYSFVKRIKTPESSLETPDNMKGICACAATKKLYFTTTKRLFCIDLVSGKSLWDKALPLGCDRMSITPDGKFLYVPSFEKEIWNVVDGPTGAVVATIEPKSGAHNTVVGLDGTKMYLAGLKSSVLTIADTKSHKAIATCGPFGASIRPFTVNGAQTKVYVNVNNLFNDPLYCWGLRFEDNGDNGKL